VTAATTTDRPTIKAVIAYADRLRARAENVMNPDSRAYDPYARPYYPTTYAARKVYHDALAAIQREDAALLAAEPDTLIDADDQRHRAAERALATMATRARRRELEHADEELTAQRALDRHKRRQRQSAHDRDAVREGWTLGQRLDHALAQFSVIAAPGAAPVGKQVGKGDPGGVSNHGDPSGEAAYVARKLIRQVEELLDKARLRDTRSTP
jgi:hypothetical protein